jgi:hypothetical protein
LVIFVIGLDAGDWSADLLSRPQETLEKCSVCMKPIVDRILRATGKPYHAKCLCCVVCGKCLDGIPFTVDAHNRIHCVEVRLEIFSCTFILSRIRCILDS